MQAALLTFPLAVQSADGLVAGPAPDFALKSFDGSNHRLSEYRSEVVVVNFWAEWCGSCREQLAVIEDLYVEHAGRGFAVLSINIDKDSAKARRTVADLRLAFPVLSDDRKSVSRLYELDATPALVMIDAHGIVRHVHEGYDAGDEERYRGELLALLSE